MKENSATIHVVTTLEEVAWIFNIRGKKLVKRIYKRNIIYSYYDVKWQQNTIQKFDDKLGSL